MLHRFVEPRPREQPNVAEPSVGFCCTAGAQRGSSEGDATSFGLSPAPLASRSILPSTLSLCRPLPGLLPQPRQLHRPTPGLPEVPPPRPVRGIEGQRPLPAWPRGLSPSPPWAGCHLPGGQHSAALSATASTCRRAWLGWDSRPAAGLSMCGWDRRCASAHGTARVQRPRSRSLFLPARHCC